MNGFKNILIDLPNDNDQIIRAAMESIGFLTNDIINCFKKKQLKLPQLISVSGGAARKPLLQFISNVTGIKLHQCVVRDKTAMGVFKLLNKKLEHQDMSLSDTKIFSPTLLILIDLVSIDKNKIRSYNIDLRLIDLFVSKEKYLKNKSQKNVISKFSKGIIYQDNILGQSSSQELSMNIEETLDQLLKSFSKSWYKDNPTKLF